MLTNSKNGLFKLPTMLGIFGLCVEGDEGGKGSNGEGDDAKTVTITQDKLDGLINDKYKAGASKATEKLLSDLGFDSVDMLKDTLKTAKDITDGNKSELQKALDNVNDLTKVNEGLQTKLSNIESQNKILTVAGDNGVKDVELFSMLYKDASTKDDFDSDKFIRDLKESRGYLFTEVDNNDKGGSNNGGNPKGGSNNHQGNTIKRSDFERLTPGDRMKKIKDGVKVID